MKNDVSKVLGRQRKVAGAYARYEFNKRYMLAFLIIGIALGLLIYPSFYNLIILIGLELFPNAVMAALACLIVLAVVLSARQINKTWFVGYLAEKQVGDCLESLLTRNNYAVAHNVDSLIAGDIDHLVATPTELWVIETKYRRLPAKKFREALQKLQTRADCVKQEFGSSVPLRRVLILTEGQHREAKDIYDEDTGSPIYVWDLDKLRKRLREHIRSRPTNDLDENMKGVCTKVWELSSWPD